MKNSQEYQYVACAPPRCACAKMKVFKDPETNTYRVEVKDDFQGVINISPEEMALMSKRFLEVWNTGVYK